MRTVVLPDATQITLMIADGELEGSSALLMKVPEEKITIVMLNNTGMSYHEKQQIALEIVSILLNL